VRRSIEFDHDDHPADDDERPQAWWIVGIFDECEGCGLEPQVELTIELQEQNGERVTAHLNPATARKLRLGLKRALEELGEPID
jgi:hypothetical protein